MKEYNSTKSFDMASLKNAGETEIRTDMENVTTSEFEYLNTKNIHNKNKKYR